MAFEIEHDELKLAQIKVIGVGGAGGNAVSRMARGEQIQGCELVAVNTDAQALRQCQASRTVTIGQKLTKGLGAGCNPELGRQAAEESSEALEEILKGTDMVFITAGMGGGTGTGAAPVLAELAKNAGILTVGVVTKPFSFEGTTKMRIALNGIEEMQKHVDSLIIIPNEKLRPIMKQQKKAFSANNAFAMADAVLGEGVLSITQLIQQTGLINTDFADVTAVMKGAGLAHMALGVGADGEERAKVAVQNAIDCPLLETSIDGATGVIVYFDAPSDFDLAELYDAMDIINEKVNPEALIIMGLRTSDTEDNAVNVTVIATGFSQNSKKEQPPVVTKPDPVVQTPDAVPPSPSIVPVPVSKSNGSSGLLYSGPAAAPKTPSAATPKTSPAASPTPEIPQPRRQKSLDDDEAYVTVLETIDNIPPVG